MLRRRGLLSMVLKKNRPGRLRLLIGSWCQRLAWRLLDPHNSWAIDYHDEYGRPFGVIRTGFYSTARAAARELKGKIVGSNAREIPAGDDPVGC